MDTHITCASKRKGTYHTCNNWISFMQSSLDLASTISRICTFFKATMERFSRQVARWTTENCPLPICQKKRVKKPVGVANFFRDVYVPFAQCQNWLYDCTLDWVKRTFAWALRPPSPQPRKQTSGVRPKSPPPSPVKGKEVLVRQGLQVKGSVCSVTCMR